MPVNAEGMEYKVKSQCYQEAVVAMVRSTAFRRNRPAKAGTTNKSFHSALSICPEVREVGDGGLEPTPKSSGNMGYSEKRGTQSGTVGVECVPTDQDLQLIVRKWAKLPHAVRLGIMAMVQAARGGADTHETWEPESWNMSFAYRLTFHLDHN